MFAMLQNAGFQFTYDTSYHMDKVRSQLQCLALDWEDYLTLWCGPTQPSVQDLEICCGCNEQMRHCDCPF